MLSEKIFKASFGVAITVGALGFGLFVGSGPSRAQDTKAPPKTTGTPKDQKEFEEATAANKETDPKKKLDDLNKWKADYPQTDPILVDVRRGLYMVTYMALGMTRETFDEAHEVLKDHPTDLTALADSIQVVTKIKPAPSAADLDQAEKDCWTILNNPAVFSSVAPAQLAQTTAAVQKYAKEVLLAIYADRKDNQREANDLTMFINKFPNYAMASNQLGGVMQKLILASGKLTDQPLMFWQFGRAVSDTGPDALNPAQQKQVSDFLTKAYQTYHGSTDGLQPFIAQTKTSPFAPAGFTLKSTVDLANEAVAKDKAEQDKDPVYYLWVHLLKEPLLKDGGDQVWENNVKDTLIPPPDASGMPQYFKAHIISMTPETKPKEILVAVEKPDVADAKLKFDMALPGKMEPGEVIQFQGAPVEFQKEPFLLTFEIQDYKKDMNGTWTGKNAAPARGPARSGTKSGAKSTGKAATK